VRYRHSGGLTDGTRRIRRDDHVEPHPGGCQASPGIAVAVDEGVAADRHDRHDATNLESVTGNTMPIRPTVLVVEDEPALRQIVVDSLESTGFAVAQAADAGDALARLEGFAYDGLVLDLRLPDGDGMDVLDAAM